MRLTRFILVLACIATSNVALAKTCELSITGNDRIQYNKSELVVASDCTEVKLTLEHVGKLPIEQMGHNWTLTRTKDWKDVAMTGQGAGLENDYLPKNDDRIIAHTDVIGGGETTRITFDRSELEKGGDYTFFCSFPGHWANMNGKLIVQ